MNPSIIEVFPEFPPKIYSPSEDKVIELVFSELRRAEKKHPGWPRDVIHAATIVGEESGELQKAALQYHYDNAGSENLINEAAQTAAMGIRFLLSYFKFGYDRRSEVGK